MLKFLLMLMLAFLPGRLIAQVSFPMDASQWTVFFNSTSFPPTQSQGSISFDFPQTTWCGTPGSPGSDCGENYSGMVIYTIKPPVSLSGTLAATFQVSTVPTDPTVPVSFDWQTEAGNTCSPASACAATTRFYIQDSSLQTTTGRWWATIGWTLRDSGGSTSLSVPLQPQYWVNVYGHLASESTKYTKDFQKTLASVDRIGWVAGGGYFYGHGVSVSGGSATFTLSSFGTQ